MFYTSSAKYLKCQQTYNLSLFQQNIAFVSNIQFCKTGLTNKRNYGNIQTEHVSLFTYYFVFVVPVHQHFALIQYKRDSLLYNQILIFQRWHKLTISRHNFTIWKIRYFMSFDFGCYKLTQKHMSIYQKYFYNEPKVMSKSIQSAWQLVIIEMTLIIPVCFKLEQHFN